MNFVALPWDGVQPAVEYIASSIRAFDVEVCGVYGFPRGGLPLAVALSHLLGVPMRDSITPTTLLIDDIYETGRTFAPFADHPRKLCWVWANKSPRPTVNFVATFPPDAWLVMPWEDQARARADAEAYYASRQ